MTSSRRDGLNFIVLGSLMFVLFGVALSVSSHATMVDFKLNYYPARCLIQHCDPYNEADVMRVFRAEQNAHPVESARQNLYLTGYPYWPTIFFLTVPLAVLPFQIASLIWMTATGGGLILASFLMWDIGAELAPVITGALIGFLLANSELCLVVGNVAGIVVSLCVVAAWCFIKRRFVAWGVVCLAVSLAIKPHDTGLIWMYFLLAGGVYRRRALQTFAVTVALSLPGVLWVTYISPHWLRELQSNMQELLAHGATGDPGPASSGGHALEMMINLQTAISVFRDEPRFYNPVSYVLCGVVFLILCLATLRVAPSPSRAWLAIASLAALTMLPVYHRQADAKLLLLTIPALAILWTRGGLTGWLALAITTAGFVLTSEIPWAIVLGIISHLHMPDAEWSRELVICVQVFPIPLILLVVSIFYLWVYARHAPEEGEKA